jgi:hypothetical protein
MTDVYYVCPPSPANKLEAAFVYRDTLQECSFLGVVTSDEMLELIIGNGLWSMDEENELTTMPSRLDTLKVEMYHNYAAYKSKRVDQLRKLLAKARERQYELSSRRHTYDLYTAEGLAESAKLQYLLARNTVDEREQPVNLEELSESLMRSLIDAYIRLKPTESALRSLSQNHHWRMIWSSGRQEGRVFGVPSIWLTDEQQALIAWSKLYDSIHEHPEPPPKEVIEDDDLLDGWVIIEQKKRDKSKQEVQGHKTGMGGAQEVFIPVESAEDARRVDGMNEAGSRFTKRQRMAVLQKRKVVGEQNMPDSQQKMSVQAAQQFRDRMKQQRSR